MNIKAILIASAAIAVSAFTMSAQCRGYHRSHCNSQPCAVSNKCDSLCARPDSCRLNPFAGISLTAEQKTKLQQACPAARSNNRENLRQARMNARKEYLAKVKSILTPEQYSLFLENNFVNGANAGRHSGRRGGNAWRGRGSHGRAPQCCGNTQCPVAAPSQK